ncbi:MAG: hypothetical protein Q9169_008639, partial [Polycauliona sp. 2 TL-2023]
HTNIGINYSTLDVGSNGLPHINDILGGLGSLPEGRSENLEVRQNRFRGENGRRREREPPPDLSSSDPSFTYQDVSSFETSARTSASLERPDSSGGYVPSTLGSAFFNLRAGPVDNSPTLPHDSTTASHDYPYAVPNGRMSAHPPYAQQQQQQEPWQNFVSPFENPIFNSNFSELEPGQRSYGWDDLRRNHQSM